MPPSKSSTALPSKAAGASPPSAKANGSGAKMEASKTTPRISMVIQSIPPFRGANKQADGKTPPAAPSSQPLSPTSQQRLNVNATSFRPNPKAAAFTPVSQGPFFYNTTGLDTFAGIDGFHESSNSSTDYFPETEARSRSE